MGIDLTLCPNRFAKLGDWFLCYDRLQLSRDYRVFDQIKDLCNPLPIPREVRCDWYGDEGLRQITEDPYGSPLKYVYANHLAKVKLPDDASQWNSAVFAFIKSLRPDTPILLYWH